MSSWWHRSWDCGIRLTRITTREPSAAAARPNSTSTRFSPPVRVVRRYVHRRRDAQLGGVPSKFGLANLLYRGAFGRWERHHQRGRGTWQLCGSAAGVLGIRLSVRRRADLVRVGQARKGMPLYFYFGKGTKPSDNADVLGFWKPVYGTPKSPIPLAGRMRGVYLAPALPGTELDMVAFQTTEEIQAKPKAGNRYEEIRRVVDPLLDKPDKYWPALIKEGLKTTTRWCPNFSGPALSRASYNTGPLQTPSGGWDLVLEIPANLIYQKIRRNRVSRRLRTLSPLSVGSGARRRPARRTRAGSSRGPAG